MRQAPEEHGLTATEWGVRYLPTKCVHWGFNPKVRGARLGLIPACVPHRDATFVPSELVHGQRFSPWEPEALL